jgi:hypothetical protein
MAQPEIGIGDVVIELDADQIVLKPTAHALKTFGSQPGGIQTAVGRCITHDFAFMLEVVRVGANLNSHQIAKYEIEDKLFRFGANKLAVLLCRYLSICSNGGRPRDETLDDSEVQDEIEDPLAKG